VQFIDNHAINQCKNNPMPRFHCSEPLQVGTVLQLPEACAHHVRVLRLAVGDEVILFNGRNDGTDGSSGGEGQFRARLQAIDKKQVSVEVLEFMPVALELPFRVTVAQALPEASKMDWIIEKAVELGAAAIAPLTARRCVVKLAGERLDKKQGHWERVIIAATEQSGRVRPAALAPVRDLAPFLAAIGSSGQTHILLTPRAGQSLAHWAQTQAPQAVTLLIGPEGGFTEQEENAAMAAGAVALAMGPRILRTETAALAAIATLTALWEGKPAYSPGAATADTAA